MRLRSDIFVAALIRAAETGGAFATLRHRGADAAGAILVHVDRRDGTGSLYGPAPQSLVEDDDPGRRFVRMHAPETLPAAAVEERIARERKFDPDLWVVEIEDPKGRTFLLDLARPTG